MTKNEKLLLSKVIKYSEKYEINIQFWPDQKSVFVSKDGIELNSWGASELEFPLKSAIEYLDRINHKS